MDTTLSRPGAGQLLDGRYRVGSWIARGGMATVYLGIDTKLDRTVALKIAHPELAGDREFVRRFTGEARSVARLNSPNVVAVYDQGCDGDLLYLVMEYVPGRTLRELLRERGGLGSREALDIISGVLTGLAAAHQAGIIHRDVKPENVLLGEGNVVKVADFGLARAASGVSHTRTGMLIGTAAYLAPEQVAHSTSDARTDVYAAGVMLFEMLTGAQPHTGDNPLAVAHKHVNEVVPAPSSLVPGLPSSVDTLVALATSRDPGLRPADAGQFLRAIADGRGGLPSGGSQGTHPVTFHGAPLAGVQSAPPADARGAPAGQSPGPAPSGFPFFDDGVRGPAGPASVPAGSDGTNHTLVVPGGGIAQDGLPYGGVPYGDDDGPAFPRRRGDGYRRRAEPLLQRWLFSRRFVYAALGVGAALIIGLIAWWVTTGQYVTVPPVRAMAVGTARTELENLGFAVKIGPSRHDNTIPQGAVIQTDPAIGASAHQGAVVTITVSTGPVMISMPQVTGQPQAAAIAAIKKAGLTPGQIIPAASTIAAGTVISTNPVAGTSWPQPRPVTITVSAGPPLPNFVGQPVSAAQAAAQQGGYQINQVPDTSSNQPAGTITSQSPAPGTPVSNGEVVTVHVSNGPPMVPVPDVRGLSVADATRILQQAGFEVAVTHGILANGNVRDEHPMGEAPRGSTITIVTGIAFP
jgi:beta-lactam-binding protein with PASTA domain